MLVENFSSNGKVCLNHLCQPRGQGRRLPKCSSPSFPKKVEEAPPAEIRETLLPLLRLAEELSDRIKVYDERIEKLGREKYEHTE